MNKLLSTSISASSRRVGLATLVLGASACGLVSVYIQNPAVDIETVSTRTARIVSAHFYRDGEQISLRGEAMSFPVNKGPFRGHLDIEIVDAERSKASCLTVRPWLDHHGVRKRYSLKLEALPEPGSIVRVWHDPARVHVSCDASRPSATAPDSASRPTLATVDQESGGIDV